MENRLEVRSRAILVLVLIATLTAAFAFGKDAVRQYAQGLFGNDKVTVVVTYVGALGPGDAGELEESIGNEEVAPYLETKGYEVDHVISFHQLIPEAAFDRNGPLRAYFNEREPDRDSARVLFVTVVALPINEESVTTGLALIDMSISKMAKTQRSGPPSISMDWTYEGPTSSASPKGALKNMSKELEIALDAYNQQRKQGGK